MIDFHRRMLADKVRNEALYNALQKVIVPGQTTVADIGSGTGILAFMCEKLGAKEITLYESGDIARVSKQLIAENKLSHCHVVQKHSTQVKNPVRVDVVVSETLGNYALEEHILETLMDAKRFVKPGGMVIPCRLRQYIVPVVTDRYHTEINDVWGDVGFNLTFEAAKNIALQNIYVRTFTQDDLLRDAVKQWDMIDFRNNESSERSAKVTWEFSSDTKISGYCMYWEADLVPIPSDSASGGAGSILSTSPTAPATHWEQLYLPLRSVVDVKAGDVINLQLKSDTRLETGLNLQWHTIWERAGKKLLNENMDMQKGFVA